MLEHLLFAIMQTFISYVVVVSGIELLEELVVVVVVLVCVRPVVESKTGPAKGSWRLSMVGAPVDSVPYRVRKLSMIVVWLSTYDRLSR